VRSTDVSRPSPSSFFAPGWEECGDRVLLFFPLPFSLPPIADPSPSTLAGQQVIHMPPFSPANTKWATERCFLLFLSRSLPSVDVGKEILPSPPKSCNSRRGAAAAPFFLPSSTATSSSRSDGKRGTVSSGLFWRRITHAAMGRGRRRFFLFLRFFITVSF